MMLMSLRPICLIMASLLALTGCAQMPTSQTGSGGPISAADGCADTSLSRPERQLCQDEKTYNQTIWGGAATGAAVGALLGGGIALLSGKKPEDALKIAAISGGAGAAIGALDGYVTAKQQQAATRQQRTIDAITDDVRSRNQALASTITNAETVVADGQQQLFAINQARAQGAITLEQANAQRAKIQQNNTRLNSVVTKLEQQRAEFVDAGRKSAQQSPEFNQQIATLDNQIAQLKQLRDQLSSNLQTGIS